MKRKLFGTDGIRGKANVAPMTAETVLQVAMSAARQFRRGDHRHKVLIGKDTRLSGYLLEPALTAGFISMGMDVVLVGPLPTPAVAMLTRSLRADLGVMISASHNPYEDNGISFGPDGYKLSDAIEEEIEARLAKPLSPHLAVSAELGRASRLDDASGRYIEYVKNTFPKGQRLDGLKIVVDCAHGAAYKIAPKILWELGAEVIPVAVAPDGENINHECGATHPATLQHAVIEHAADLGIALDGDADRIILCDEKGQVIDGDQMMALIARSWHRTGQLNGNCVVATIMSNLGLERFLKSLGLELRRMPVGDRYVVDHMRANGCNLGGEQSGHIIMGDYSTTGDGLIAALQALAVIGESGLSASEVCHVFEPLPQLLRNVRYQGELNLESEEVQRIIRQAESRLKDNGRVLVRKSGTEPLIRVMAEGDDEKLVAGIVEEISMALQKAAA